MTAALVDPGQTVERLLDAAETLFAERGLDAVSVRAVNAAAGANVAAVHYHFGSKDALVDAVLRRRMAALGERRLAMLPARSDPTPSVRAVMEALVLPLAELSADATGPGRAYVRFLATLEGGGAESRAHLATAFAPQFGPLDAALARALPELPEPVRHFRLRLVGLLVLQTLAHPEEAAATLGITDDPDDPDRPDDLDHHPRVVDALLDTLTGALSAPSTATATGGTRP